MHDVERQAELKIYAAILSTCLAGGSTTACVIVDINVIAATSIE